jgi:hypothetical protein
MNKEDLLRWYVENEELYKELTNFVEKAIKIFLTNEGLEEIEYALVDSRLKTRSSFLQKMYNEDKQGNRKYSSNTVNRHCGGKNCRLSSVRS